jgi:uncharacterized protein with HEPN domain
MSPREYGYLLDMLNAAKLAQDFVANNSLEDFQADLNTSSGGKSSVLDYW